MAFTTINPAPAADQFNQFYASHNNNANFGINSMVQLANIVTFYNLLGGTFGTINLPLSPNVILSGLVASSLGFALSTTAGTYQVANILYSIGAGAFTITAAHPTLNRIDVLVVNNLGAYVYITGTPAVNAVAPAITLNQLAVTYINVPAAGVPNIGNQTCCIPDGVTTGQTLRWDNSSFTWQISNDILSTTNQLTLQAANIVSLSTTGVQKGYFFADDFNSKIGVEVTAGNFEEILVSQFGVDLVPSGVIESRLNMGLLGGIAMVDNLPSVTANRLYNVAGTLYFNGNELCIAPCGGGGLPIGTADFSTLRYDLGAAVWVANIYNIAKDGDYNLICNAPFGLTSLGVANKATGILFSQWTGPYLLQSRASVILACGDSITINHIPSVTANGSNIIHSSSLSIINLHTDYRGLMAIETSINCQINDLNPVAPGFGGKSFIKGSDNCNINDAIDQNSITSSLNSDIQYATLTTVFGCSNANVGLSGSNLTLLCGAYGCTNSTILSTAQSATGAVMIGCTNGNIDGASYSGLFSGDGNSITALLAGASFQNVIIGGTNNDIPVNANNISNSFILGGQLNTFDSTLNAIDTCGLVGCYSSGIDANTYYAVGIGLNGGSYLSRSSTVVVSSLDSRGARIKHVYNHTSNTVTVQSDDHVMDCQNVNLFATQTTLLPASPEDGREVIVTNSDGTCNAVTTVTINGNGKNINGAATQIIITPYFFKTLIFVSATNRWIMS